MKDQEILGLMEAYSSMYVPQELTEEVEIAAQYFYEMGLNENGVDILIEELGVEEFSSFVYDIAEDYCLTEARAGGVKIEPKLTSGKEIKGKPKAASLKALRKKKVARQEAENKASESKPSGMKASLQRQSAVAAAVKKQPETKSTPTQTKQGIGSKIGSVLKRAGEDIAITYKVAREVGKRAEKSAPVRKFWGFKEEVEAWVNQLVEEGYDLSEYTWDEMMEIYEAIEVSHADEVGNTPAWRKYKAGNKAYVPAAHLKAKVKKTTESIGTQKESYDVYDLVLSYLLDEGYAESVEQAEVIMTNMSEEWRESIVERKHPIMSITSASGENRSKKRPGATVDSDSHEHENPDQIERRRFSQQLSDRKKKRESEIAAGRLTVATKRGIEKATNRSDDNPIRRSEFAPDSALKRNERDDQPTDYRARKRRASGR